MEGKWSVPPRRGGALTKIAKELIALLVAVVVLVGLGVAYAANTTRHTTSPAKGDHAGKDDSLLAEGLDGLVGRWLGDDEDPGEPPD